MRRSFLGNTEAPGKVRHTFPERIHASNCSPYMEHVRLKSGTEGLCILPLGFGGQTEGLSQDLDTPNSDTERTAPKFKWESPPPPEGGTQVISESQF